MSKYISANSSCCKILCNVDKLIHCRSKGHFYSGVNFFKTQWICIKAEPPFELKLPLVVVNIAFKMWASLWDRNWPLFWNLTWDVLSLDRTHRAKANRTKGGLGNVISFTLSHTHTHFQCLLTQTTDVSVHRPRSTSSPSFCERERLLWTRTYMEAASSVKWYVDVW